MHDFWFGTDFSGMTPKAQATKEEKRQIRLYENLKILFIQRHCPQSKKATHRMGENICKSYTWLLFRIYREFLKTTTKQTTQFNNGQRTWTDISPKKIFKWPISTQKYAQHH